MALDFVIIFDDCTHEFGHVESGFFVANAIARAKLWSYHVFPIVSVDIFRPCIGLCRLPRNLM